MTNPLRKWSFGLALALVSVVVIVALWPGEKEPNYQGKTLSEWLFYADDMKPMSSASDDFDDIAGPKAKEAAVAVRAIGRAAVPVLLRWFEYKPSALRTNICWAAWKLKPSPKIRRSRLYQKLILGEGLIRSSLVPVGFRILGPVAAPAVPELAEVMERDPDRLRRTQAMLNLIWIGEAASAPLLRAMTNQANPDRRIILYNIGSPHRENASTTSAIPALVQCLADPQMAIAALTRLKDLAVQPEIVIPALTNALASVNSNAPPASNSNALPGALLTQVHIIRALAAYESRATNAVPALVPLLQSAQPMLCHEATNALRKICPAALNALPNPNPLGLPPAPP